VGSPGGRGTDAFGDFRIAYLGLAASQNLLLPMNVERRSVALIFFCSAVLSRNLLESDIRDMDDDIHGFSDQAFDHPAWSVRMHRH
jgi:hypothetical protein